MKLIFIYGPPAAGKLTVAEKLSRLIGFPIFHNHLTNDMVESIFARGTPQFTRLVNHYRLELLEEAARAKMKGLIFTYVYARPIDNQWVDQVIKIVRKYRGSVYFVQLDCHPRELFRRVRHPRRKRYAKIHHIKILKKILRQYELQAAISHPSNLVIDNTRLSPQRVAMKIKKHYHL